MNLTLTAAERRAASLAALLGNALEWFDFAVYGYVATSLGHLEKLLITGNSTGIKQPLMRRRVEIKQHRPLCRSPSLWVLLREIHAANLTLQER